MSRKQRRRKHPKRDLRHLDYIERRIADIHENVGGDTDKLTRTWDLLAAQRAVQTLFESARNLDGELQATEPHIDWEGMGVFRNELAHDYMDDEIDAVRDAITMDLPRLVEALPRLRARAEDRLAKWTGTQRAPRKSDRVLKG